VTFHLPRLGLAAATLAAGLAGCSAPTPSQTGTATVSVTTTVTASVSAPATPGRRSRVVLAGDSLFYAVQLPAAEDFVAVMQADRPDLDVIDDGVPGNTASDLLARIRDITDIQPAAVVVWIGTNDALQGVSLTTFSSQLDQIVAQVTPARVVLVTPIADLAAPTAYLMYANAVRRAATAHGTALVDLEGRIARSDFLADGSHLSAAAVARVGRLIEAVIPVSG
jgi:lysophospholipase L1-like esterase